MCGQLKILLAHPVQSRLTISRNTSHFPKESWEFPEWKRKKFSHIAFITSLIIRLQTTVNYPFTVQDRPMDFSVGENEIFIDMIQIPCHD